MKSCEETDLRYQRDFAAALDSSVQIEVYLLDFELLKDRFSGNARSVEMAQRESVFPVAPYGRTSRVLSRRMLTKDEVIRLLPSFQATLLAKRETMKMRCHYPIHGIRIWSDDFLIFETSICYFCHNYYFTYPDGRLYWADLSVPEFETEMRSLMPIPEAEIQRFNDRYRSSKTENEKGEPGATDNPDDAQRLREDH